MSGHHAGMIKPKYAPAAGNKRTGRRLMDVGGEYQPARREGDKEAGKPNGKEPIQTSTMLAFK